MCFSEMFKNTLSSVLIIVHLFNHVHSVPSWKRYRIWNIEVAMNYNTGLAS